jgi:hypothetical protein
LYAFLIYSMPATFSAYQPEDAPYRVYRDPH